VLPLAFAFAAPVSAIEPTTDVATVAAIPGPNTPGFTTACTVKKHKQNCAQVRAIVQDGETMFAAGSWSQVTDPTTRKTSTNRKNLVAFNRLTGALLPAFAAHTFNGLVRALAVSPDGATLYVGGEFTKMDCHPKGGKQVCTAAQHLVALDAATGALLPAFRVNGQPTSNPATTSPLAGRGRIRALLVDAATNRLYVGGDFNVIEGQPVSRLAALDLTTGALIPEFAPSFAIDTSQRNSVPAEVSSLAVSPGDADGVPSRVYAGGHFDTVNGAAASTLVALDPASGATDTTFAPVLSRQLTPYDQLAEGMGVVVAPDGTVLLAQGGQYNRGYRFALDGTVLWSVYSGGDLQTVALSGDAVYFGGHFICWSNDAPIDRAACAGRPATVLRIHLAVVSLDTGALDADWAPLANPNTAPPYYYGCWKVFVSSTGDLYAGGLFQEIDSSGGVYARAKLASFPHL
jgi:hypothetical protein